MLTGAGPPAAGPEELWRGIEQADGMPAGRARIALLEDLLARAAGWPEVDLAVRVSMVPACLHGGEHQRVPDLLADLLARYDEAPAWFGHWERHGVLFCFTWATVGLLQHPDVPLARLERTLATMDRYYRDAGQPPAPVLRARFLLTSHVHGATAAAGDFEAWRAAGRSDLSECAECELAEQVTHLAARGRQQQAVELAMPVLAGAPVAAACAPGALTLAGAVLGPLLETGAGARAAAEHVRAVRLIRTLPPGSAPGHLGRAGHLLACARTGRLTRGLDLLEEWLPWYAGVGPPSRRMEAAAAAGRLLRGLAEGGNGALVLAADGADPTTGDELGARLAHEARDLASRFDARNGTGTAGDRVEQVLESSGLPDLPLDAFSRSPRASRVRPMPGRTRRGRRAAGGSSPALPPAGDVAALAAAFEAALRADSQAGRAAVLDAWRGLRRSAPGRQGRTPAQGGPGLQGGDPVRGGSPVRGGDPVQDGDRVHGGSAVQPPDEAPDRPEVTGAGRPVWSGWPTLLGRPHPLLQERAAARLDGWTALADLTTGPAPADPPARQVSGAGTRPQELAASALAAERLRAAGLTHEALLHEQAALLAAAQAGKVDLGIALERAEQVVTELRAGGDLGLALSRVVLLRELAAARGLAPAHPAGSGPAVAGAVPGGPDADRGGLEDPLDAGLAALRSVPPERLDHQQLRALARLLRVRARDEPADRAAGTLREAVAALPDGVRPLERAQAGADLAGVLQDVDPVAALAVWDRAIEDAAAAAAGPVSGDLLAARAALRHALADAAGAAEDLIRAVPLLDAHAPAPLAAQARLDLCRVLLDLDRPHEAAEVAEAGLADVTDLLAADGVSPDDLDAGPGPATGAPPRAGGGPRGTGGRAEVHLAGCLAYAAAEANGRAGAAEPARELAGRSADWHRVDHNLVAQSEAWELAARLDGPPGRAAADLARAADLADAAGDWVRAANCRRERVTAVRAAEGAGAALVALGAAQAALDAGALGLAGRHVPEEEHRRADRSLRWHRLALAEERGRLLAVTGRFPEALAEVDGLEQDYQELGDAWSARDLLGLRGQLRAELDDLDGALDDLRRAVEEARGAGDRAQAQGLAERLAAVLSGAGRTDEADAAWQRFAGRD